MQRRYIDQFLLQKYGFMCAGKPIYIILIIIETYLKKFICFMSLRATLSALISKQYSQDMYWSTLELYITIDIFRSRSAVPSIHRNFEIIFDYAHVKGLRFPSNNLICAKSCQPVHLKNKEWRKVKSS